MIYNPWDANQLLDKLKEVLNKEIPDNHRKQALKLKILLEKFIETPNKANLDKYQQYIRNLQIEYHGEAKF